MSVQSSSLASHKWYAPQYAPITVKPQRGRPIGLIAVKEKGRSEDEYNPLEIQFSVSYARKDMREMIKQAKRKPSLSKYQQALFDSCFKNW